MNTQDEIAAFDSFQKSLTPYERTMMHTLLKTQALASAAFQLSSGSSKISPADVLKKAEADALVGFFETWTKNR